MFDCGLVQNCFSPPQTAHLQICTFKESSLVQKPARDQAYPSLHGLQRLRCILPLRCLSTVPRPILHQSHIPPAPPPRCCTA